MNDKVMKLAMLAKERRPVSDPEVAKMLNEIQIDFPKVDIKQMYVEFCGANKMTIIPLVGKWAPKFGANIGDILSQVQKMK